VDEATSVVAIETMPRVARVSDICGAGYDVVVEVGCVYSGQRVECLEVVGRCKFSWPPIHLDITRYDVCASRGPSQLNSELITNIDAAQAHS
jgi:hypothetical protein